MLSDMGRHDSPTNGRLARCLTLFFFQAEDGIRDLTVTGVQTCALPISCTTWDKHRGARCQGVQVHVTDAKALQPVRLGAACIVHARAQDPVRFRWRTEKYEFVEHLPAIDLLAGSAAFRTGVEAGRSAAELCAAWDLERDGFVKRRAPFLLY